MADNDVGYRRPPAGARFKKGSSGNPKGRPKGARNLKTDLLEELHGRIAVTENGRRRTVTRQQALIRKLMVQALSGESKAVALLLNLMTQFERAGDWVAPNTPTSEEDRRLLERYAGNIKRQVKRG